MSKALKFLILVGVLGGMMVASAQQEAKPLTVEEKPLVIIADKDKNKIFDNLETLLTGQPAGASFDTIVLFNQALSDVLTAQARQAIGNFAITHQYSSISGIAATLTKGQIMALSQLPFVKQVEHDALVYPHLDTAQQWFGTTKARADFGVDGNADGLAAYSAADIVVAILDTGIDTGHLDLDGGKVIAWQDFTTPNPQQTPYDELGACAGHGTHVSSIAAGEGNGNPAFKGVAPGAALVGLKVLRRQGNNCVGQTSWIDAAIQWIIDNKNTYGIEVANMSLGVAGCSDGTDSTSVLVNSAVDAGIVMTVSAGNEGPGSCTIGSPAAADKAITVGAMADVTPGASASNACGDNDLPNAGFYLACFSSRGPTADGRMKPDIASPGTFINAAAAGTTNGYKNLTGTSMSSPFTAGVAALMLDANSALTAAQVKSAIENNSLNWGPAGKDRDYGAGRLQGYEAVKSAGSFTGTGPSVPAHSFISDSLGGINTQDFWNISVTDASLPIAITMIMPDWAPGFPQAAPDFDMELRDPSGTVIASSISATRQETIGVLPATTGTYQLRVYIFSGSGPYFFDVSFGQTLVSITLTTDGTTPFGIVPLGQTVETTASGTNDVQTVQVTTGPANLSVRSTAFSDGINTWTLGTTNGANQVKWEFAPDTVNWTTFATANTLFNLGTNIAQGANRNLYLRLTTPTSTSSNNQHSATVTIVATAP